MRTLAHAARAQQPGEAIGGLIQRAIADRLAAARHDDGRMVRARLCVRDGMHVSLPQRRSRLVPVHAIWLQAET